MSYTPQPIDTLSVALEDDLRQLVELLAQNNHDHWAMQRMSEGWRWGPHRDDLAKLHPDLTEYSALPESEKEYDRLSVTETLKAIIALGYAIRKPLEPARS